MRCSSDMSNRITLDVGGTYFYTTRATLSQHDSFFRALIEHDRTTDAYFIDRDPTHFRHVLNFLRNSPTFPKNADDLVELQKEADFYSLDILVQECKKRIEPYTKRSIEYKLSVLASKIG